MASAHTINFRDLMPVGTGAGLVMRMHLVAGMGSGGLKLMVDA